MVKHLFLGWTRPDQGRQPARVRWRPAPARGASVGRDRDVARLADREGQGVAPHRPRRGAGWSPAT